MTERQQPAESQQQVERAGEQREAKRLHQKHRVDSDEGGNGEKQDHCCAAEREAVARETGRGSGGGSRRRHYRSRPKRPAGRRISTITMTTKITVFDASG